MSEQKALDINYKAEYTPAKFHGADDFVRGIMGPVGCMAGDTLIVTEHGLLPIERIDRPMRVLSWNKKTNQFQLSMCGGSFPKGKDYLYRVITQQGEFVASGHHRSLCADGNYQQVKYLSRGQSLRLCSDTRLLTKKLASLKESLSDGQRLKQTVADYLGDYAALARQYGQQFLVAGDTFQSSSPLQVDVQVSVLPFSLQKDGQAEPLQEHTHLNKYDDHAGIDDCSSHVEPPHSSEVNQTFSSLFARIAEKALQAQQYLMKKAFHQITQLFSLYFRSSVCSISEWPILSIERLKSKETYWDMQVVDTNNYVTVDGGIHHNSGKSVACCIELVSRAMQQEPGFDGVRRFRAAAIRNSYPELKTTTIKTWQDWFPDSICRMNWGSPITGTIRCAAPPTEKFPEGTRLEFEIWFLALDRPKDVKKLLSMELTMAWINEARELPRIILDGVTMRVGRYPAKRQGKLTFTGVILDTNPPDDDHWWYSIAEVEKPEGFKFWRQPGALIKTMDEKGQVMYVPNPEAENVDNQPLGFKYWTQMVHGKSQEWIKSYVLGQYATVYDGKPIYNEYNDSIHCAEEELEVMRGITLYIGLDFGRTPAAAFFQLSPTGQVRVLDEIVSEDMGIRRFVREALRPKINNEYGGMTVRLWGDPSGGYGVQTDESTCMDILEEEGFPTDPASTQNPLARREAVAEVLLKNDIDGEPGFILSPKCKYLRKGFNGAFMYERVQVVGEERYKDQPKKNIFSHIHEALQYGVLMIREGLKIEKVSARPVKRRSSGGWAA